MQHIFRHFSKRSPPFLPCFLCGFTLIPFLIQISSVWLTLQEKLSFFSDDNCPSNLVGFQWSSESNKATYSDDDNSIPIFLAELTPPFSL